MQQLLLSPAFASWSIEQLSSVSPAIASSLESLLEYEGDDLAEVFELDWPNAGKLAGIPRGDERSEYVCEYVCWYFQERFKEQIYAMCEGFRAVVGHSVLLSTLVTPPQLEQIICGVEEPLDVAAVRKCAKTNGWNEEEEQTYLAAFWQVVQELSEEEKNRFAQFVSSSTRMPLKGWSHFEIQIQKNGEGDERLPTAYTCFHLILLPLYSSPEVLRTRLMQAINETQGFGLN